MTEPTVRLGTQEDMEAAMNLMRGAVEENAFVDPDMEKIAIATWGCLTRQNGIAGIASVDGIGVHGVVFMTIGSTIYSKQNFLQEHLVYVMPEWRHMKYALGRRLIEFAKSCSDTLQIPLMIGVLSNSRTKAKVRLYERAIGQPAGAFFLYNGKTGLLD